MSQFQDVVVPNSEVAVVENGTADIIDLLPATQKYVGHEKIYPNQFEAADILHNNLYDEKCINQVLTAPTQSGKTGCLICFLDNVVKTHHNNPVAKKLRIIYVVCDANNMLTEQTEKRVDDSKIEKDNWELGDNLEIKVLHRYNLRTIKFKKDERYTTFTMVIFDECHIGLVKEGQISAFSKRLGFDLNQHHSKWINKNIAIVSATATSSAHRNKGGGVFEFVSLIPGPGYYGAADAIKDGRIKISQNPYKWNSETKSHDASDFTFNLLEDFMNQDKKLVLVLRLTEDKRIDGVIKSIRKVYNPKELGIVQCHSSHKKTTNEDYKSNSKHLPIKDVDDIISNTRDKTLLIIRQGLRAGQTITDKSKLFNWFERFGSNTDTTMQGIGRVTGYLKENEKDFFIYCSRNQVFFGREAIINPHITGSGTHVKASHNMSFADAIPKEEKTNPKLVQVYVIDPKEVHKKDIQEHRDYENRHLFSLISAKEPARRLIERISEIKDIPNYFSRISASKVNNVSKNMKNGNRWTRNQLVLIDFKKDKYEAQFDELIRVFPEYKNKIVYFLYEKDLDVLEDTEIKNILAKLKPRVLTRRDIVDRNAERRLQLTELANNCTEVSFIAKEKNGATLYGSHSYLQDSEEEITSYGQVIGEATSNKILINI